MKDAECVELQDIYITTRSDRDLKKFYDGCMEIGYVVFSGLKRKNHHISELADTIVTESVNDYIMRYVNNPEYRKDYITSNLFYVILNKLYNDKLKISNTWYYKHIKQMEEEDFNQIEYKKKDEKENTTFVIQDILKEHPRGGNILIAVSKARSYREFIKNVETIVGKDIAGRRWIYDHAVRLYSLYKYTRVPNERSNINKG